ncbi:MAG: isopeptide-forming domain-containing fimbrial protein [Gammaproteobacteria bacterium]
MRGDRLIMNAGMTRIFFRLLLVFLLLGAASGAQAGLFCSDAPFNGVVDGNERAELGGSYTGTVADPFVTQITIDTDCTFQNFSASDPLTATLNFQTNDPSVYLITFDNVIFTGNMACSNIDHRIWFVNGSDYGTKNSCQDLFIPVEAINKQNPPGTTTVGIGEPFTYTLNIPVLYDPATGTFLNNFGSANDLHSITITDDLNATGANLTLVGTPTVTWLSGPNAGNPVTHTFTNVGGLLTFEIDPASNPGIIIPAGDQLQIAITVVADNTNPIGTQIINTARWTFGRLINIDLDGDGIPEPNFFDPLPGENGVTEPLIISAPELVVDKSSTETALNIGVPATFTIDIQNAGGVDAWNATIVDQLPNTAGAGTCPTLPTDDPANLINSVTAQLFQADGVTPVAGALLAGTDYTVSYNDANGTPACELTLDFLSSAAVIGPNQIMRITYDIQLDTDTVDDNTTLTNFAGATRWYSADPTGGYPVTTFTRTITDGTPASLDHQDSYSITTGLSGYYFQKTVQNITSGENPATVAAPGDTLRYRLRLFNVDQDIESIYITDILDPAYFDTSTFSPVSLPAGSTYNFNSVTGELQIFGNGGPLNLSPLQELIVDFEIDLLTTLSNGDTVPNQATLEFDNDPDPGIVDLVTTPSDDPYDGYVAAPGDPPPLFLPTTVEIVAVGPLSKVNPTQTTATIGDQFTYTITIPATTVNSDLYDVRIWDDLTLSSADMRFVSASVVSGGSWTLTNTGTDTAPIIEDISTGIDIPAGTQAVFEITVELDNTLTNQSGLAFNNRATYYFNRSNGNIATQTEGGEGITGDMTIVEPDISTFTKTVNNSTPTAGEVVRYSVTLTAAGGANDSDVFDVILTDTLDLGLVYEGNPTVTVGGGVSADNVIGEPDITGDGITTAQTLVWSPGSTEASDIDIVAGTTVTIEYDVRVLDSVLANTILNNSAVAEWSSNDGATSGERTGVDGSGGLNDYITTPATATLTTPNINATITKVRSNDTYGVGDDNVRVGDIVEYTLTLSVPEGTLGNLQLVDTLPQGLDFEGVVSINGNTGPDPFVAVAPFTHADIPAANIVEAGDPATGPTTVTWTLGDVTNQPNDSFSDNFVIIYRARVLNNVIPQANLNHSLNNSVNMSYDTASGTVSPLPTDNYTVTVNQPALSVSKTALTSGGDPIIVGGETITYTIDVTNNGTSPAYDVVLEDVLPVGLDDTTVNTSTISLVVAATSLTTFNPAYNAGTRTLTWNFDSGTADEYTIPAGDTLRIVYTVLADAVLAEGLTLTNAATATLYYSFDDEAEPTLGTVTGVRETYGPSNTASTSLYTGALPAKVLLSPATPEATIGQEVIYQITVPGTASTSTLYDIQVIDTLDPNLGFVSATVTGGIGVTDNSTVSPAELNVLIDEIPAGQQVVIEVRTQVLNVATAQEGVVVNNTASYTYAYTDGGATQPALTSNNVAITIIEPILTLEKTGPATLGVGIPGSFTLNIHNIGSSPAYDLTVTDLIPNPAPGGMCDDTVPNNFNIEITQADLTPVSTLAQGTDYTVNFTAGTPTCTLTFTMLTPAAALPADYRYIITYDAYLDADTGNSTSLTNYAGATEWFNADTAGSGATGLTRTYTETITDGSTTLLDFQDAHTLVTELPTIEFRKTVTNQTSGQGPASGLTATPGDVLRYEIVMTNLGTIALNNYSLTDEVDRLNGAALFAPGTISNVSVAPATGNVTIYPTGGANGTGLLDISNLSLGAAGSGTETVTVTFDVTLAPSIADGTIVYNQAEMTEAILGTLPSDDPIVNGPDDPGIIGDEDYTPITITSAPLFQVQKISDDITGLPTELQPGDRLHYTITVKNIGTEDAVNATLRDLIPANTTYYPGTTYLNGTLVPDIQPGDIPPLESGIMINSPGETAGNMPADATATTANVATITFDVVVNSNVLVGTIISNQGYVNAEGTGSGPISEQPSDDPDTVTVNDPTRDIVGVLPLVDAQKTVELYTDNNGDGVIDPDDVLRYTITVTNSGSVPATGVRLVDTVPANTTYEPNSVYLNDEPVADPAVDVSPLEAGIDISSADQTPPLPTPGNGYLSSGGVATVTFDVRVDLTTPGGTVISNQGIVSNNELPDEPTDADGDDSNGDQPTLSVVGYTEQLSIIKQVAVVGGGPALAGSELEYTVTVTNIGQIPATDVVITDDLSLPVAGQKSLVINSATMNGVDTGVSYVAPVITANYSSNYGNLLPGETVTLRFRVLLDAALTIGTTVTNIADVYWDDPDPGLAQTAQASVSIDIGATPGFGTLSGQAWHDADFDNVLDVTERVLAGWTVELRQNGNLIGSVLTDANGLYQIEGVPPNIYTTPIVPYELRFIAPGATTTTALLGRADSDPLYGYTNGLQYISEIDDIGPGTSRTNLNLPIDPNGVVYDSVVRAPIAGATLTMINATSGVPLPATCFDDQAQQGQVTLADGYYKFDINFGQLECQAGENYLINVAAPAGNYVAGESTIIPPTSSAATAPFSVPACLGSTNDAVPATANYCEVQTFETAPAVAIAAGSPGTNYHLHLTLSDGQVPGESQLFNNHIPLDQDLGLAVGISKVSSMVNVTRGELVPYTITINNTLPVSLSNITLTDTMPAGFKYVEGSARLDGVAVEPDRNGLQLNWTIPSIAVDTRYTVKLLLVVGAGVQEGEYINRARAFSTLTNGNVSEQATATVRVVPDPVFDCSDIIGKVFDDKNLNGHQDENEKGLQGVRLATARGLLVTSDKYGRFHITCAATPDEQRGSNFILKLDERTLPSGYRVTTENPRVQRLTRGKMIKFNFGATVHRVVRIDIADGVFEKNSDKIRPQWLTRVGLLIEELRKAPSVLRLTYLGDVESSGLVDDRLETLRDLIKDHWDKVNTYKLVIEEEVFWRNGGPNGGGGLD